MTRSTWTHTFAMRPVVNADRVSFIFLSYRRSWMTNPLSAITSHLGVGNPENLNLMLWIYHCIFLRMRAKWTWWAHMMQLPPSIWWCSGLFKTFYLDIFYLYTYIADTFDNVFFLFFYRTGQLEEDCSKQNYIVLYNDNKDYSILFYYSGVHRQQAFQGPPPSTRQMSSSSSVAWGWQ